MHRLFAALAVPDDLAEQLTLIQRELPGARWRQREHFHITLSFFGDVSRDHAEAIGDALDRVSGQPMQLNVQGVGWFGRREPRAVYAKIPDQPALTELARSCRKATARIGAAPDSHPFVPHITLAYCKGVPLEDVRTWCEQFQMLSSEPFWVSQFHLYESFTAMGRPSQYQIQAGYNLA